MISDDLRGPTGKLPEQRRHVDEVRNLGAITLFVEDLPVTKAFYAEALGLRCVFEDAHSAVFDLGNTLVNLLDVREAPGLIAPARVAGPAEGARGQFTIWVDDA